MQSQTQGAEPASFQNQREQLNRYLKHRPNHRPAKNIILFIGDGMGISTMTASRILEGQQKGTAGEEHRLSWEHFLIQLWQRFTTPTNKLRIQLAR